jgi:hypothetical protein
LDGPKEVNLEVEILLEKGDDPKRKVFEEELVKRLSELGKEQ